MARSRNNRVDIMLNDDEYAKLCSDVSRSKLSKADYIRRLIMNKIIKEKPDDRFYDVMFQMTHIGNNLNQIARKANHLNVIDKDYYLEQAENWNKFTIDIKKEFL